MTTCVYCSGRHSFRAIFFCVDKANLRISVQDVIDFIANILDKISSLPGVGDILTFIDKALESIMGWVEDLIPDAGIFPDFNMVSSPSMHARFDHVISSNSLSATIL